MPNKPLTVHQEVIIELWRLWRSHHPYDYMINQKEYPAFCAFLKQVQEDCNCRFLLSEGRFVDLNFTL